MTKFTKWKKWQKLIQGLYPNHVHISRPWQKHVQSFIKIGIKFVWGVALKRYPLSLDFHRNWGQKITKFTKWKKWQKLIQGLYLNHMHISRPWRKHVQSYKKISIKLYEELCSQSSHYHNIFIESEVRKWQSSQSGKSNKNKCKDYIQTICISSDHGENMCKVSKRLA